MDSKLSLALMFLLTSSWVCLGFCENSSGGGGGSAACLEKLLPCEAFLRSSTPPGASCCIPMKDLIVHDSNCLCHIFNNAELLKSFNITRDDALKLPLACGTALVDTSLCKSSAASPPPSPPPTAPSTPATSNSSASGIPSNIS